MRIIVFIPTYNEKENLEPIVREIMGLPGEYEVLVVDDLSPDGTGDIADRLAVEFNPRVHVVHRQGQRGRGSAGSAGFQEALKLGADAVIEMDADFSHQPKYLPAIAKALETHDIVIGSRYIPGGNVEGWGIKRKLNSWVANRVARLVLKLPFSDNTSGYRGFRWKVLETVPWNRLISPGPSILQEMLYHALKNNPSSIEIPIVFVDRTIGESKLNPMIILRWIHSLWKVRKAG